MSPRWHKVLADLKENKVRTLLVVLSIAVGVFAVGTIAGIFSITGADMEADYRSINGRSARLLVSPPMDDELVAAMEHVPGVSQAQGQSFLGARARQGSALVSATIAAIPEDGVLKIDRVRRTDGGQGFRLGRHEALLETSAHAKYGIDIGDNIDLLMSDWSEKSIRVAGFVQDLTVNSAATGGPIALYVAPDTMEWLGGSPRYNRLLLTVSDHAEDLRHVKSVADDVSAKLKSAGVTVDQITVYQSNAHPAKTTSDALLMILALLCVLTVALSAFLVVNTITALLGQQLRQIGVLKAVGASSGQVFALYLALVECFGLLALIISVPLAALASWGVASFVSSLINFNLSGFRIPPLALALELAVALLMPLAAALIPVRNGTRITIRQAIANYGLGQDAGRGWLDRALARVRGLPRPWLLSLRNTFRRKARLFLTLSTLTLGGAIFISVLDLQASFLEETSKTYSYMFADVNVVLSRPYRIDQIENVITRVPGVMHVEAWNIMNAQALPLDPASPAIDVQLQGPPAGSTLVEPILTAGRWLVPEDENAIVIENHMTAKRPDLRVGDTLTIRLLDRDTTWHIVGIYRMAGASPSPMVFLNREPLERQVSMVGQAAIYRVATAGKTPSEQKGVALAIEQALAGKNVVVGSIDTGNEMRAQSDLMLGILISFMLMMAVLIAVVGGLGLMGTMSMNVLERTREIGVLRAIGASSLSIMGMILLEGLVTGGSSWLLGTLLSMPIGAGLSYLAGISFVQVPMPLVVSVQGVAIWLLIALTLSAIASLLPAWNASRLTIREVLAYE